MKVTFTPIRESDGTLIALVATPFGDATLTLDLRRSDGIPLLVTLPSGTVYGWTVELGTDESGLAPQASAKLVLQRCTSFVVECFERDSLAHFG